MGKKSNICDFFIVSSLLEVIEEKDAKEREIFSVIPS